MHSVTYNLIKEGDSKLAKRVTSNVIRTGPFIERRKKNYPPYNSKNKGRRLEDLGSKQKNSEFRKSSSEKNTSTAPPGLLFDLKA